ncbi:MAG: hypothetical protein GF331_03995 [Chitinivibrionales bacterium]|nr:hypothetical protein [Chitinivibrionales bacterium]
MYTKSQLRTAAAVLAPAMLACAVGCSDPSSPPTSSSAGLAVRARVVSPAAGKQRTVQQTTWDSLVLTLAYPDANAVRRAFPLSMDTPVFADTVAGLAAGDNIQVTTRTVNAAGIVVHESQTHSLDLSPNETAQVSFWLEPVRSSIYVELSDVPTSVATVAACFVSGADTLCVQTPRSPRITSLSIDNVPDGAAGELILAGLDTAGDTLYTTTVPLTSHADGAATIWADFTASPAGLTADITVSEPQPTLVVGSMGGAAGGGVEHGPLVISEIMYAANGDEYIELHNPGAGNAAFDTLIVEKDGDTRFLTDVSIPPGGFYVIGRTDSAWVDTSLPFLDLSSTSGNTLTIRTKRDEIVDWVAFVTRSNDIEWPDISSARVSIVLDSLAVDPAYNNYGAHWRAACTPLGADSTMCGTPGRAGA